MISSLPTPCLLVDLGVADRNIEVAASKATKSGVALRPHFKAHKCTQLMRRQLDAGECVGVTCQTPQEAQVLANAGFKDILIASQVADANGLRIVMNAASLSTLSIAVDSTHHVDLLNQLSRSAMVNLGVVIEIDVGMGRCGLPVGSTALLDIARAIEASPKLELVGLQAYEGHAVLREDRALRKTLVWQAASQIAFERDRLVKAGFDIPIVTGGGTGTLDLAASFGVLNEIQAGSYVLMDARYASLDLPFQIALFCVGTVISRRSLDTAVANVGLKALTVEYGLPRPCTSGVEVVSLSDEHSRLSLRDGTDLQVGDPVVFVPSHVDPAVNLHETLFVWTGHSLETWAVDGRRSHQQEIKSNYALDQAQVHPT